jgi:hypothetical protein
MRKANPCFKDSLVGIAHQSEHDGNSMVAVAGSGIDTFYSLGSTGCVPLCLLASERASCCAVNRERFRFISRLLRYIEAFFPACQGDTLINKKVCLGS